MLEKLQAQVEPKSENSRSNELLNYILKSSDTPEMRIQAIKNALRGKEISEYDYVKIEQALQNQQFAILKKFIEEEGLKAEYPGVPEDAAFPKTYFQLINQRFQDGLISEQHKSELIGIALEKNTETTEEKIARIKNNLNMWVQEPTNKTHRHIRTLVGSLLDSPGKLIEIQFEKEKVDVALEGYLDIWEIKSDGERNEARVIRKNS